MKFWRESKSVSIESRSERSKKRLNQLGIIPIEEKNKKQVYRNKKLHLLDEYYENEQYEGLEKWESKDVPLHKRQPKIKFGFAKTLSSRVSAKIIGQSVFPEFTIKDIPDDNEFIKAIVKHSKIRSELVEPMKRLINTGSIFIRFKISGGAFEIKYYEAKYCYPEFQENGELERLVYKYIYDDPEEKKSDGKPVKKWYKVEFNTESEILYDNPEFNPQDDSEPIFTEVDRVDHGLGFVQGEWFRTAKRKDSPDGYGIIEDILDFIKELDYSISQSSRSVSYNQDPQLLVKGMDEDMISSLIRSVTKAWDMGRDGDASFLESDLSGVKEASNLRDKIKGHISDIARVTLLDPEKMVGSAQSAKAMEVLMGPLVDLIDELRAITESQLKNLVFKMAMACLLANAQGIPVPIQIPEGYVPQSLDIDLVWPSIFKMTLEDMQKKVALSIQAANANIISRKTATNNVKEIFGIVDIEAEHAEIAAQPVFNPFGGF